MSLANLLTDSEDEHGDVEMVDNEKATSVDASHDVSYLITEGSLTHIESIKPYCHVLPKLRSFLSKLRQDDDDGFLTDASSLLEQIKEEIAALYTLIKINYKPVWPDLDGLIKNPVSFSRVIITFGDDVSQILGDSDKLTEFLEKDEILGLTMSSSVMKKANLVVLDKHHIDLVIEACELLVELDSDRCKIQQDISIKAHKIAPNVTAIVGSTVCSQLLAQHGLEELCKTPACNLASLGVNNSSSVHDKSGMVRNRGYLYGSELVQSVPEHLKRSAMRQVAAKVALASRVDFSGSDNDEFGRKWHDEIASKLEKLKAPPESMRVKPLAKPVDRKSTKRGGRRFRKQKQKMKMSEIEKARNRMTFAQKEEVAMDEFGEEIGLGMVGKFSHGGSYRALAASDDHNPRLTKDMKKRLENFKHTDSNRSMLTRLLENSESTGSAKRKLSDDEASIKRIRRS
ncbi:hypothetical protein FOA43_000821 [Brettanomyces nanus]|uniref:Nop domain-containing protein n=1 Tax=Eeniella nana TaxID=13502 RepID=A0A875RND5_EENNA|nr:uncharacterized protein FOA43_000821 [Brettanomyces nanus]QPG73510.1 hypothetical protein FOA43_000821 [Brettanomyces nanus]